MHDKYFGIFSHGKASDFSCQCLSSGVHYLITPKLEVGVRFGWGHIDQSSRFFTSVGFHVHY